MNFFNNPMKSTLIIFLQFWKKLLYLNTQKKIIKKLGLQTFKIEKTN